MTLDMGEDSGIRGRMASCPLLCIHCKMLDSLVSWYQLSLLFLMLGKLGSVAHRHFVFPEIGSSRTHS
jgi:hypothetical protein